MKSSCPNIFSILVYLEGIFSHRSYCLLFKLQVDFFCFQQVFLLHQQIVFGLNQYPLELVKRNGMEADSNRETAQKLRDEIFDFGHGKRPTGDKEDVICLHVSKFGIDNCALDQRQEISLDSLCGDSLPSMNHSVWSGELVDLIQEYYPFLLHVLQCLLGDVDIRVHKLELIKVHGIQNIVSFPDIPCDWPLRRIRRLQTKGRQLRDVISRQNRNHMFVILSIFKIFQLFHHHLVVFPFTAQHRLKNLQVYFIFYSIPQIFHKFFMFKFVIIYSYFDQVLDNRADIFANVPYFRILRGFHPQKWSIGQFGEASGNFSFPAPSWALDQQIFWSDFIPEILWKIFSSPAISERYGNSFLGLILTDDVLVKILDNPFGSQRLFINRIVFEHFLCQPRLAIIIQIHLNSFF